MCKFWGPIRSRREAHKLDILLALALCGKFPRETETEVRAATHRLVTGKCIRFEKVGGLRQGVIDSGAVRLGSYPWS